MELDDLKNRWIAEADRNLKVNKKNAEQLNFIRKKAIETFVLLRKKYKSIISALSAGLLFNVLISPMLPFILGEPGPLFRFDRLSAGFLVIVAIFCLSALAFYLNRYIRLNEEIPKDDLKQSLQDAVTRLRKLRRTEIVFISVLSICLFIVGRTSSQVNGNGDFWSLFKTDIMISFLLIVIITGFYIYKRVKVYRQNIYEFQQYLSEIEEE